MMTMPAFDAYAGAYSRRRRHFRAIVRHFRVSRREPQILYITFVFDDGFHFGVVISPPATRYGLFSRRHAGR